MSEWDIFEKSAEIGADIIKYGREISKAEDTVKRINRAYKNDCTVFALPSLIVAQCGKKQ
ncbi:MAG: threonine/serine exporter family protein [Clostridiales bacterium]|nr:threonine/serine exporter family protein [Clostridiales bacterium]